MCDVIFGAVNVMPFRRWRRALRPGGTTVTVNPIFVNGALRWLARTVGGARLGSVQPSGADLETIGGWISTGQILPVVDRRYMLAEAHAYSESKRVRGKLVLVVRVAEKADSTQREADRDPVIDGSAS
ncbi:MAG TPA: zinc-binding dehydrogenase [Rubrobacter sp.]|nr:zinc-binding dehydrogenase [Rubrobacter sp.]